MAFASACGPTKSGLDSIALHSDTQAPQLMQSDSLWTAAIRFGEITCSRPAGGIVYPGWRYGLTERNFDQNGSMSTTRSLRIGMFPIAEITGALPASANFFIGVLHASTVTPSIRIAQEPQIIIRQLRR